MNHLYTKEQARGALGNITKIDVYLCWNCRYMIKQLGKNTTSVGVCVECGDELECINVVR